MFEIHQLPTVNASLNGVAALLLLAGRSLIKQNKKEAHKRVMIAAFTVSALFLISYLTYHFNTEAVTKYEGIGFLRYLYFFILITHIVLAMIVPVGAVFALVWGLQGKFARHKKLVVWFWPVWMYVSVTGVLIYLMLYVF